MKLFGMFGSDPKPRVATGEEGAEKELLELSVERAFEKFSHNRELVSIMEEYQALKYAMEHTKRASVLSDRQKLKALEAEAIAVLRAAGVKLAFVPTRFNKAEDSSFKLFADCFKPAEPV